MSRQQNRTENSTDMAHRVAVFGAIRRAATIAREWEYHGYHDYATEIRFAIRFALHGSIGSDKA